MLVKGILAISWSDVGDRFIVGWYNWCPDGITITILVLHRGKAFWRCKWLMIIAQMLINSQRSFNTKLDTMMSMQSRSRSGIIHDWWWWSSSGSSSGSSHSSNAVTLGGFSWLGRHVCTIMLHHIILTGKAGLTTGKKTGKVLFTSMDPVMTS